jgi:hypothetical protein
LPNRSSRNGSHSKARRRARQTTNGYGLENADRFAYA